MATYPMIEASPKGGVRWYKSRIDSSRLKTFTRRSDANGLAQAIGHLLLVTVTGLTAALFAKRGNTPMFLGVLWVHGIFYSFIPGLATHELSHGTVFRSKGLNKFFYSLYSLLGWTNPYYYKASHTYHHRFTLFRQGDGEAVLPGKPRLGFFWMLGQLTFDVTNFSMIAWGFLVLATTGRFAGVYRKDWSQAIFSETYAPMKQQAVRWARLVLLFHILILTVSGIWNLWYLPLIVTTGPFIANFWRYLIGATMHTGLRDDVADWRKCARTIILDPVSRFLYWNMNFHIEHHMYAAVPCYNLPALSRELAPDMPATRTLISAWKEMRETYRIQKSNPEYQYDTPVPGEETQSS